MTTIDSGDEGHDERVGASGPHEPVAIRAPSFEAKFGFKSWMVKVAVFSAVLMGVGLGSQLTRIRAYLHEWLTPPLEQCGNHLDDDGDGYVDEDCPQPECGVGDGRDNHNVSEIHEAPDCREGTVHCEGGRYGSCPKPLPVPIPEVCSEDDRNCDDKIYLTPPRKLKVWK